MEWFSACVLGVSGRAHYNITHVCLSCFALRKDTNGELFALLSNANFTEF